MKLKDAVRKSGSERRRKQRTHENNTLKRVKEKPSEQEKHVVQEEEVTDGEKCCQ